MWKQMFKDNFKPDREDVLGGLFVLIIVFGVYFLL